MQSKLTNVTMQSYLNILFSMDYCNNAIIDIVGRMMTIERPQSSEGLIYEEHKS
jgi:hypothetical protein